METKNFCQSCGMPMGAKDELFGTELDGNKSEDYCKYCYENGSFTRDVTAEEMIEICIPHVVAAEPELTSEEARKLMREVLPGLKRWKKG